MIILVGFAEKNARFSLDIFVAIVDNIYVLCYNKYRIYNCYVTAKIGVASHLKGEIS